MTEKYQLVTGPDGQEFEFPVNMSDDEINSVLEREYKQPAIKNPAHYGNIMAASQLPAGIGAAVSLLPEGAQSRIGSATAGLVKGGTFGFSDEIVAGLSSLSPNITYKDSITQQRAMQDAAQQENPKTFFAGEIVGAGVTGGAGVARQGAAKVTLGGVAKSGALAGGAYGAGTAEGNILERSDDAAIGAALGAVFAPLVKIAGDKTGQILGGAARNILSKKPSTDPSLVRAQEIIQKLANESGQSVDDLARYIDDAASQGDDLLFQRLGLTDQARGFAANNTPAQQFASQQIAKQKTLQKPALEKAMRETIGDADFSTLQNGITSRLKEASKLYSDVLAQDVSETPALKALRKDPFFKQAARFADKAAKSEARNGGQVSQARYLQLVKEGLDDKISSLYRNGKAKQAGLIRDVRDDLLEEMDAQLPGFSDVRKLWGGEVANKNALETGRRFLGQEPRDIAADTLKMSESERRHYFTGMLDALSKKIDSRADGSDLTRVVNDRVRKQLEAALPDGRANEFFRKFGIEAGKRRQLNAVDPLSGSQTQPRQQAAEAARQAVLTDAQRAVSRTANALSEPLAQPGRFLKLLGRRASIEDPDVMEAVTRLLFTNADEASDLINQLSREQQARVQWYIRQAWPQVSGRQTAVIMQDADKSAKGLLAIQ